MRIPHNSVVLVADGRKRLFFRNEGEAGFPNLVVLSAAEDGNPKTRDQGADSPLPAADARFAIETADALSRGVQAGEYGELIVMAPPKTLGRLRKHYHPEVENRILREIGKDVTSHPVGEIEKMLVALD